MPVALLGAERPFLYHRGCQPPRRQRRTPFLPVLKVGLAALDDVVQSRITGQYGPTFDVARVSIEGAQNVLILEVCRFQLA